MPSPLAQLGWQTAGQAAGGIMGMFFGKHADDRQYNQQKRLQELQIKGQKEMAAYNYASQLGMWKDTNYAAQRNELEKAGLNPGLLYGMSGGGGATTGSPSANVTGATATQGGGGEIVSMAGMGMQIAQQAQLLQAQKELLQAQTEKTKAEAQKTAGVDTAKTEAETQNLLQGYDNLRNQHDLQKLEITMRNIENFEKQATQQNRMAFIETQTKQAIQQLKILQNEAKQSDATLQNKIKIVHLEAIGAGIKNALMEMGIQKTQSDIQVNRQQIQNWYEQNERDWKQMNFEERKIRVQELLKDWNTDPNIKAVDQLTKLFDNIFFILK